DVAVCVRPQCWETVAHRDGILSATDLLGGLGGVHLALLARAHVAQGRLAGIGAENQRVAGGDAVRLLHLALDRTPGEVPIRSEPGAAHRGDHPRPPFAIAAPGNNETARLPGAPLPPQRQRDPLDAQRPPRRRRGGAAQLLDQAVVAPAASDPRLGPEPLA